MTPREPHLRALAEKKAGELSNRTNNFRRGIKGYFSVPVEIRFERFVKRVPWTECWLWSGCHNQRGYPILHKNGRNRVCSRTSWEIKHGKDFPEHMHACHSCDNPGCVNPDHIWPGTNRENMLDASRKGRLKHEFCKWNHRLDDGNFYLLSNGYRLCKQCSNRRSKISERTRVRIRKKKPEIKALAEIEKLLGK